MPLQCKQLKNIKCHPRIWPDKRFFFYKILPQGIPISNSQGCLWSCFGYKLRILVWLRVLRIKCHFWAINQSDFLGKKELLKNASISFFRLDFDQSLKSGLLAWAPFLIWAASNHAISILSSVLLGLTSNFQASLTFSYGSPSQRCKFPVDHLLFQALFRDLGYNVQQYNVQQPLPKTS